MKKLILLATVIILAFALTACNRNNDSGGTTPESGATITDDAPIDTPSNDGDTGQENNQGDTGATQTADPTPTPTPVTENGGEENGGEENGGEENGGEENGGEENGGDTPAPSVEIPARPADVVWSLSTDEMFQNLAAGTSGTGEVIFETEYLMESGNPRLRVIENPRSGVPVAVRLTDRDESWYAIDIVTGAMNLNTSANSYRLTVHGNLDGSGNVIIQGGDSPWATMHQQSASGDFTVEYVITADSIAESGERGHIRVTADTGINMDVHEIEIRRVDLVQAPAPVETPTLPANVLFRLTDDPEIQSLAMGTTGNAITGSPFLQDSGSPTLTIVENPLGGNAIQVSNRSADWHTIDIVLVFDGSPINLAANSYTINVRGTVIDPPAGSTVDIMGAGDPWGRFYSEPLSGTDFNISGVVDSAGMAAHTDAGSSNRVRFAISADGGEADYVIHEIEIRRN